ncbi:MAG: DUF445 domain-containing protein [Rhodospirillales bacterium]|nr:DUF445 domain-containing protein [Rhodospirillales bacterium]
MGRNQQGQDDKRLILNRHRLFATGTLVVMVAIYIATRFIEDPGFWELLIRAGAEAGIIGGLADWFAVTALFRHPLGIPIPHTALVSKNKDRIGKSLGEFISNNFLTDAVVVGRMHSTDIAGKAARWLAQTENAHFFTHYFFSAIPYVIGSLRHEQIRDVIRDAASQQLGKMDLAPTLGRIVALIAKSGDHRKLFDKSLSLAKEALEENKKMVLGGVKEKSFWWVPGTVDKGVAKLIITGVVKLLDELTKEGHPAREKFEEAVDDVIEKLQNSESYRNKVNELRDDFLENQEVHAFLGEAWDQIREVLLENADNPSSELQEAVANGLEGFGQKLMEDDNLRAKLNKTIEELVIHVVLPWRHEIGNLIADEVHNWDSETIAKTIELEVGSDLQYIRINGTLVGCLIGGALFLLTESIF